MYFTYKFVLVICASLITPRICILYLPDEMSPRLSLAKCVARASEIFFRYGDILLVSLPIHEVSSQQKSAVVLDRLIFLELFQVGRVSLIIKKTTNPKVYEKFEKAVNNYLIQVRNVTELPDNLNVLQQYTSWNPHAKFLIISVTIYEDNVLSAAYVVEQLWQRHIANAVILFPNKHNQTVYDVYSWFPFKDGNSGSDFETIEIIDKCSYGAMEHGTYWYPNKIPRNLNGYTIRVRTVVWPPFVLPPTRKTPDTEEEYSFEDGLEIHMLNTMAEVANFTIIYTASNKVQDWGYIEANGSASGALLYLKEGKADLAVSAFAASQNTRLHFEVITYPIPESLKWCVPRADMIPVWKYFVSVFQPGTFVCVLILYTIASVCLWKFSYFEKKKLKAYATLPNTFQTVFSALLNVPVRIFPNSNIMRSIFLLWIIFSQLLGVYYQTFLTSILSKIKYKDQIDTVEKILENNLHLWVLPVDKLFFTDNNDWLSKKVIENWDDCLDINMCLHNTAFNKSSATCIPHLTLRYLSNQFLDSNRKSLLYCFENNVVTYPLEIITKKGFLFKEYFTNLLGLISDAGFPMQWGQKIFERTERKRLQDIAQEEKRFSITIKHLICLFLLLGIGYTLGFIVFLYELFIYKKT